jgi:hypothetical protein
MVLALPSLHFARTSDKRRLAIINNILKFVIKFMGYIITAFNPGQVLT